MNEMRAAVPMENVEVTRTKSLQVWDQLELRLLRREVFTADQEVDHLRLQKVQEVPE